MFKKPFKLSQSNQLSNKDKKNLIKDLKKNYPPTIIDLLMKTYDKFLVEKFQGNRMLIYKTDKYPAFVDYYGQAEYIPTLYVIAEFPQLVQSLIINEGVERFILNGANLMWPGVIPLSYDYKKDDLRSIVTADGSLVALGQMASGQKESTKREGIAAYTIHWVGDELWAYGPQIVNSPRLIEDKKSQNQSDNSDKDEEDQFIPLQKQSNIVGNNSQEEILNLVCQVDEGDDENQIQRNKKKKKQKDEERKNQKQQKTSEEIKLQKDEELTDNEEDTKQQNLYPTEELDQNIKEAFLNSLKIGKIDEKQLPMDASVFYSNYILFYKREGVIIDLKHSSYKKIGKFLTAMHKDNFIEYKEAKKGQQPIIQKINFKNQSLLDWIPTVDPKNLEKLQDDKKETYGFKPAIQVLEVYRPKPNVSFVFKTEPRDKLYTKDEWRKVLHNYVTKECTREKKFIKLTDPNIRMLSNQLKKKQIKIKNQVQQTQEQFQESASDLITSEDLQKAFEQFLIKYTEITDVNSGKVELKTGEFKGISMIAEKNHNRNVTRISGLEQFGFDPFIKSDNNPNCFQCLSNYFQLKFACSVSMHDLPGKNQGKEMVVHGNFLAELVDFFTKECMINQKFIHTVNKLKPKKKQ